MRILLLLGLFVTGMATIQAQTPANQAPRPAQPATRPAQPAPAPKPAPAPAPAQAPPVAAPATPVAPRPRAQAPVSARSGVAMTVTDPGGAGLAGVRVTVLGATERTSDTSSGGQVNFPGLQAGTYRVRFSGEEVITFEREVTLRAGQVTEIDVTLNPAPPKPVVAPPPPPPPPPPPAPAAIVGPTGEPLTVVVPDLLEQTFVGNQPRRETLLSCSGNTRTTMIQLNTPLPDRLYDAADALYYVIGGEGTVRLGGREVALATNAYISVPRRTVHSFARSGRRPLILLAVLNGEPCEAAK